MSRSETLTEFLIVERITVDELLNEVNWGSRNGMGSPARGSRDSAKVRKVVRYEGTSVSYLRAAPLFTRSYPTSPHFPRSRLIASRGSYQFPFEHGRIDEVQFHKAGDDELFLLYEKDACRLMCSSVP